MDAGWIYFGSGWVAGWLMASAYGWWQFHQLMKALGETKELKELPKEDDYPAGLNVPRPRKHRTMWGDS